MPNNITYTLFSNGLGFNAVYNGAPIGEITFVRVGIDKMIIDYTMVNTPFRHSRVGLNLVRAAADLARNQRRKIIALCPFARAMFNKYPEFDDVRLMNAH